MENRIFRQKSLDRISSPEQLNDYIRVTNPSVWMMLCAILFLLAGICIWGIFGKMDTTLSVGAITANNQTVCYIKEADIDSVETDMVVRIDEEEYKIQKISLQPVQVDSSFTDYLTHVGGIAEGEWVYIATLDRTYGKDGSIFDAEIVIESIAPMTFVLN